MIAQVAGNCATFPRCTCAHLNQSPSILSDVNDCTLSIAAESFDSDDARRLIASLDAGLAELYTREQRFGPNLKAEHLEGGHGTFLVARDDGRAVGCGAIRVLDTATAEAKRMYVEPDQRGKGVGGAVLAGLVLETGIYQDAALSLYRRAGFTQIKCWGEYASSPTSICMEKQLI
jgi:putative acetyltransferase